MKKEVSGIIIFTNLLDGGKFVKCNCGIIQRWKLDDKYCKSCGRRKNIVLSSKEEWIKQRFESEEAAKRQLSL